MIAIWVFSENMFWIPTASIVVSMTSQSWALMGSILFSLAGTSFWKFATYPEGSLTVRKKSHNSYFSSWVRFMADRGGWALVPSGRARAFCPIPLGQLLLLHGPWFSICHSWVSQANSHIHSFSCAWDRCCGGPLCLSSKAVPIGLTFSSTSS